MFSEYASKFLSSSQRPAPLFDGGGPQSDIDPENYLDPLRESLSSTESTHSDSDDGSPPEDIAIERSQPPRSSATSIWASNMQQWGSPVTPAFFTADSSAPSESQSSPDTAEREARVVPSQLIPGPRPRPDAEDGGATEPLPQDGPDPARLDRIAGALYLTMMAVSLAMASLVVLTTAPSTSDPSSVYDVFSEMTRPLGLYACISVIVASGWLLAMRRNARAVLQTGVIAVPCVLTVLGFYSLIGSLHAHNGAGWAHAALRSSSLIPFGFAAAWVMVLRRSKEVVGRATEMCVLAAQVFDSCPVLLTVSLSASLAALIGTALWSLFLARAFLEGRLSVILAVWFSFMYLWTWGVLTALLSVFLSGISIQWYHSPATKPSLTGAAYQTSAVHFGSACLAALVGMIVRIPLVILPTRPAAWLAATIQSTLSASATKLLDPLTLPTAVAKRCSLRRAARIVAQSPQFRDFDRSAFKIAKLLLVAARGSCALVVGLVAWVHADRLNDAASLYGYLIAIVAFFVGWTVVGACENVLTVLLTGIVVCYALEQPPKRSDVDRIFAPPVIDA